MVVSSSVVVKADVKFHRLLRIEGVLEGKVIASKEVRINFASLFTYSVFVGLSYSV
jgi:cytoskeletal protein CcmA (bactofilin family)